MTRWSFRALLALSLLASLAAAGMGAAQVPAVPSTDPGQFSDEALSLELALSTGMVDVPRLGMATIELVIRDGSDPTVEDPVSLHTVNLAVDYEAEARQGGWPLPSIGSPYTLVTSAGDEVRAPVIIQAPATVRTLYMRFWINATMQSTSGFTTHATTEGVARIEPFTLAAIDIRMAPPRVAPFERVQIPVFLRNDGLYPETYTVEARGPPGWFVSSPPQVSLFPAETRVFLVDVVTPAERVLVPEETGVISVLVRSTIQPGVVYQRAAVVIVEGLFLPDYWLPVLGLGAVLGSLAVRQSVEGTRRRTHEAGRPRPTTLTPAQRVMMADLKKRDPERWRGIRARQRRAQKLRMRHFGRVRGRRASIERAMIARQRADARSTKLDEKARQRRLSAREGDLERQRRLLTREKRRQERVLNAERRRSEARRRRTEQRQAALQRRVEQRQARREAPERRRQERLQRARERKLRAELSRKRRLMKKQQHAQRVAAARRRKELGRRKRLLEKKAKARGRRRRGQGS